MRVKHPLQKRQTDRLDVYRDDLTAAQQLLAVSGSRGCLRCGGLLVTERMDSAADVVGERYSAALRCVQCGDLIDHVILRNRKDSCTVGSPAHTEDPVARSSGQDDSGWGTGDRVSVGTSFPGAR